MNKIDEYRSLLDGYADGLYTDGEVVAASFKLLFQSDEREAFWRAVTIEHRELMTQLLTDFDESAEPFAIKDDPKRIWREMTALKRWLATR